MKKRKLTAQREDAWKIVLQHTSTPLEASQKEDWLTDGPWAEVERKVWRKGLEAMRFLLEGNLANSMKKYLTYDMAKAMMSDSNNWKCSTDDIPPSLWTEELYLLAMKHKRFSPHLVPQECMTEAGVCEMLDIYPYSLRYVPERLVTKALCDYAVSKSGNNLLHVPEQYRDKEMYESAVRTAGSSLKWIPAEFITAAMCQDAVNEDECAVQHVPEKYLTKELCRAAIEKDERAIYYIPKEKRDLDLCQLAMRKDPKTVTGVPDKFLTEEMFLRAVEHGLELQRIPYRFRSENIYFALDVADAKKRMNRGSFDWSADYTERQKAILCGETPLLDIKSRDISLLKYKAIQRNDMATYKAVYDLEKRIREAEIAAMPKRDRAYLAWYEKQQRAREELLLQLELEHIQEEQAGA